MTYIKVGELDLIEFKFDILPVHRAEYIKLDELLKHQGVSWQLIHPKSMVIDIMIIVYKNLYEIVSKLVKYLGRVVSRHNCVCVGAPVSL